MKKNISINISGIIFHIEEDAYEILREYLNSINRYFSSFEDSAEIIADIESRIAEIFLTKLSDEKQVITSEDVDALIATMGNVSDFKAMEEEEPAQESKSNESYQTYETETRRLFRDESRRVIGGVCAGIAHYFNIDPVWIRLAFVISLLIYGFGIIPYVILWIVIPGKYNLPEQKNFRKMYRNPDERVLGGVSSGIAAYFGVDVIIIRLLFVIFAIFGGTGILVYIVLWIALPEASSISDKVRMQGEPVTLENIESNIKKNLNIDEKKEEDTITKILLFPFRLIAAILKGIGRILGPVLMFIVEAVRVLAGVLMVFLGFILTFTFLVTTAALFGIINGGPFSSEVMMNWGLPMDVISNSFPVLTVIAAGLAVIVPSIFLILLGIWVIAKRIVFNATAGWTLLAVFVISSIFLSINIPTIIYQFKETGTHEETMEYPYDGTTAILDINEVGLDDYHGASLRLRGHADSVYRVVLRYDAQGPTRQRAIENAQMVEYNISRADSTFIFDSNLKFKENAVFRGQDMNATLYIPYGAKFIIKRPVRHILSNNLYSFNYSTSELNETIWTMQEEGGLTCLTCPEEEKPTDLSDSTFVFDSDDFSSMETLEAFRELSITGPIVANIQRGDEFRLLISEAGASMWDAVQMTQDNLSLSLTLEESDQEILVPITIIVPDLEQIALGGSSKVIITDLEQEYFMVRIEDDASLTADVDITELELEMEDNSRVELYGSGRVLEVQLQGFASLSAYDYVTSAGEITARGQSRAEVNVKDNLTIDKSITARVEYKGDPNVVDSE